MSDTEIRMMRYTIEQLSAELQATRQYVSDIKSKLERTRRALNVAVDTLHWYDDNYDSVVARNTLDEIKTALKQKEVK